MSRKNRKGYEFSRPLSIKNNPKRQPLVNVKTPNGLRLFAVYEDQRILEITNLNNKESAFIQPQGAVIIEAKDSKAALDCFKAHYGNDTQKLQKHLQNASTLSQRIADKVGGNLEEFLKNPDMELPPQDEASADTNTTEDAPTEYKKASHLRIVK